MRLNLKHIIKCAADKFYFIFMLLPSHTSFFAAKNGFLCFEGHESIDNRNVFVLMNSIIFDNNKLNET